MVVGKIEASGHGEDVLRLSAEGKSTREIAEILKTQYNFSVSHNVINHFLKQVRTERAEVTKEVIREQVAKNIPADLELLDEMKNTLADRFRTAIAEEDDRTACAITKEVAKLVDIKLKYSGAEPTSAVTVKMYDGLELDFDDDAEPEAQ